MGSLLEVVSLFSLFFASSRTAELLELSVLGSLLEEVKLSEVLKVLEVVFSLSLASSRLVAGTELLELSGLSSSELENALFSIVVYGYQGF